jgi:hypothetical protein
MTPLCCCFVDSCVSGKDKSGGQLRQEDKVELIKKNKEK